MSSPEQIEGLQGEYGKRLGYWQRLLEQGGVEAAQRYGGEMIAELDALVPDAGELCNFTGYGLVPDIHSSEDQKPWSWAEINNGKGIHNGFTIRDDADGNPRLFINLILSNTMTQVSPCQTDARMFQAFMDPDQSIVTGSNSFNSSLDIKTPLVAPDDVFNLLVAASDEFATKILERQFLRVRHERQVAFVDEYLSYYEDASGVKDLLVAVNGVYHYRVPRSGEAELGQLIEPFNEDFILGRCVGLGFLGRAGLAETPIRRMSDIPDQTAGLCVILEVQDTYPDQSLILDDITYVPLSGQTLYVRGTSQE